jgi:hypothetical protein
MLEEYIADDGDQCDSCGKIMAEGDTFLGDESRRVRWRFCSVDCAHTGVTNASKKARFIGYVLGK